MIEVRGVTKRYGRSLAVDDLSFQVRTGQVTGFLGPNGAGKSTTMRMILGLDRPSSGAALVDGRPYRSFRRPLHKVGALLDASAFHPGRTARDHLRAIALSNGISPARVAHVLGQVGLDPVAGKRAGTFSLGMKQRLGIAAALLGDPELLMFDEPVNGLDPEGVLWIRTLIRGLAAEGRTVFVSSHLMSEMESTADHLVVVGRGRLIADLPIRELIAAASGAHVVVRVAAEHRPAMISALSAGGAQITLEPDGALKVAGMDAAGAGALAHACGIPLAELSPRRSSLEDAYFELTEDAVEYRAKEVAA
ncbi:ABC transporter ATP-binding protein [Actinocorallia longicatena]|uniref:ATP-binding cassette domain-containing protein n=1 Tax=Actinocorallia longicatena TaxID=111803 RepID=A0ABP6QME2_9ACTN